MEDFKKYLMTSTGSLEWDNSEICKAAAKDIMDHFSEAAGNMARSIVMNSIYQAFKKYQETKVIDEAMIFSAVERLVKMRPFALGIPVDQYSLDPDISSFSKKISAAIFANTFRQFDMQMYNKDQIHDIFVGFYKDFAKSKTIIDVYGSDLIECANQLMSLLEDKSEYKKQYSDYCKTIKGFIK